MLLTVTDDQQLSERLWRCFKLCGIFSYVMTYNEIQLATNIPREVTAVILDATDSRLRAESVCVNIKEKFPKIAVASLASKHGFTHDRFLYVAGTDAELVLPIQDDDLAAFVIKFYYKYVRIESFGTSRLKLTHDRGKSLLLGYRLSLTPKEHRILLLLASFPHEHFSADNICLLCNGEKEASSTKVDRKSTRLNSSHIR